MQAALSGQSFREVGEFAGVSGVAIDPIIMAGGVAWLDYNNDRYPDLLLTNGTQATKLFRNNWDGTFTDASESAGLLNIAGTMGVVAGDFDNDGFTDLFITTMKGAPNRLLKNNREGRFVDVSQSAGIVEATFSASATTGDYDGDGDLDIYVTNYLVGELPEDGGLPNLLYRNDGDFNFTEVAAQLQVDDNGCGLGAVFSDFNNDGRTDLYVANDFGYAIEPNAFFQNDFPSFTRKADDNGSAATINAMGIAKGDYDNDGDVDLYVTNIRENPLYENFDEGVFFNFSSFPAGVALPELTSWGTSFTDFDLDGFLDLVVANGQVAEEVNEAETQTYFHNNGDGTFSDESEASGFSSAITIGRGLAVADYDLDGYPDVAINAVQTDFTGAENVALLRNETTNQGRWLSVELPVNAQKLTLYSGASAWHREVDGGSSYLSHSAGPVHFGAPASNSQIDSMTVSFSDLPAQTFTDLNWNTLTGVRANGSFYEIDHISQVNCGDISIVPSLDRRWETDENGREKLHIERTSTLPYVRLEEQIIELSVGEVYRDLARTQDAVLVDTIAGQGPCPDLQPIRLKVLQAIDQPVVYPNPMLGSELNLQLPNGEGLVNIKVTDSSGRLIFEQTQSVAADRRIITLSFPEFPVGAYVLRLEFSGEVSYHKLIRS